LLFRRNERVENSASNGPGVTVYPGPAVLANGFEIGSDSNGVYQAHGLFNTVQTYNYPLDSNDVQTIFNWYYGYFMMSPWNSAMFSIVSAPSTPSTNYTDYDVITGAGNLRQVGTVTAISSTNVWISSPMRTARPAVINWMPLAAPTRFRKWMAPVRIPPP
jgi:hypothetical protein